MSPRPANARGVLVLALAGLVLTAFVLRLWQLQVVRHEEFRSKAAKQQLDEVVLEPPRGTIFDARGRTLAVSLEVDSVYASPRRIEDPAATATALAKALNRPSSEVRRLLEDDEGFVWVARQLDPPLATAVRKLDLEGIGFVREYRRYYPQRATAAQVIGFAGRDHTGLEGLETYYESTIAGQAAQRLVMRDAHAGTVLSPRLAAAAPEPGQDLHLTIDSHIQTTLERELAAAVERHRALRGIAVILDPRDGSVLAMATVPTFDPNRFQDTTRARWKNRPVSDVFEPGSTFKMVTAAAALEANLIDPSDEIDCEMGATVVEGGRIRDHHPFGVLTFREVIAKSSNVGAIKIGLTVGRQRLAEQISRFGFGHKSGVDLPGEELGLVRPVERWSRREPAYISFGQAISVTALQMTNAFAAVANGGTLFRPRVVAATGRNGRILSRNPPQVLGRPIGAATARTLERMLEAVVEEGTGRRAAVPGYRVAGKTGTAQKPVLGGYSPDKHLASFVGFAPAREPVMAAIIAIDEPIGAYHGGDVAAPVFAAVARDVLAYLDVAPEPALPPAAPALAPARLAQAPRLEQPPPTEPGVVPELEGLTARQAIASTVAVGLELRLHGSGFVLRQHPAAGTPFNSAGDGLDVWLGPQAGSHG